MVNNKWKPNDPNPAAILALERRIAQTKKKLARLKGELAILKLKPAPTRCTGTAKFTGRQCRQNAEPGTNRCKAHPK